jgi:hypothetical protein
MNRSKAYRRPAIFASDVRQIGGIITIASTRDRVESSPVYVITHRSRGGDCCWRSSNIQSEEQALAGARLLAEFLGAKVIG